MIKSNLKWMNLQRFVVNQLLSLQNVVQSLILL